MTALTRRTVLHSLLAAPVAGAVGTLSLARAAEFSLKYGNNLPLSHPLNMRAQEAADRIASETKGRVELKIFPNNQLGGDTDMLSQVRNGSITFFTPSALVIATVVRHLSSSRPEPPRRPGPGGPMPDAGLVEAIRAVLTASPFHGEGHRKVWARLRVAGVRTSKRRVLRLMRANNLLAPPRV